jgi:phosphoglycolate phosphatase-like HAD superfamily hydrolase
MYDKLVLVDINGIMVNDLKDVSEYIFEAIRSRYGFEAEFDIKEYEGISSKAMLRAILRKNGIPEEDINSRIDGCAEELGYTYYNVTGRDGIKTMDGSAQFLEELGRRGALVGIATGDIEDIIKNKIGRAGLTSFFKFGSYGNSEEDLSQIIRNSVSRATSEFGFQQSGTVYVISGSPDTIKAAKMVGAVPIGVATEKYNAKDMLSAGADLSVESIKKGSKIIKRIFS